MPRLKPAPLADEYKTFEADRLSFGEANDCAVIAVAAAAGVSYQEAHEALRLAGRKAKRGTFFHTTSKAMEALGFRCVAWGMKRRQETIDAYPIRAAYITTHHPHRLNASWKDEGTLFFRTSDHILCVKDGKNVDWSVSRSLRVKEVYTVEKI